jgi:hypothetical protein
MLIRETKSRKKDQDVPLEPEHCNVDFAGLRLDALLGIPLSTASEWIADPILSPTLFSSGPGFLAGKIRSLFSVTV